jgi:2-oxoglutarate ferredoxin oxidoreductase subunit gamma
MVVLGGYLKARPIVKMESVEKGLEKSLPSRHHSLIPMNLEAVQKGFESLETVLEVG